MVRVVIPFHLRNLARVEGELMLDLDRSGAAMGGGSDGSNHERRVTQGEVLDALEAKYPMLRGTIRDHVTKERRPFIRYFACEKDLSLDPADSPLPDAVAKGDEPFLIIGAIAGG